MPIFALAGLGEDPRSLVGAADRASSMYTPTELPPPTIVGTVPPGLLKMDEGPPKESGTPWFLWALLGLGVVGMVAQASKDDGYERNGRSGSSIIQAKGKSGRRRAKAELAASSVSRVMKSAGAKRTKTFVKKMGSSYWWMVEGYVPASREKGVLKKLRSMSSVSSAVSV